MNTAEVAVAAISAGSLIGALGGEGVDGPIVVAMLTGGMIAAPLAAWVIRYMPPQAMGLGVAASLLITNTRELADWAELGLSRWVLYAATPALVPAAAFIARSSSPEAA